MTAFIRSVGRLLILLPACLSGIASAQAMTAQSLEAQLNAKVAGRSRSTITRDQCVLLDTVYPDTDEEFMYAGGNALFLFAVTTTNLIHQSRQRFLPIETFRGAALQPNTG
jgi:hypothetical protein